MTELLLQEVERHGARARVLPVERLDDLKRDIEAFRQSQELNGFQKYIVSDMYHFELPEAGFPVRSVIIIATPVPSHAKVTFDWQGRRVSALSLARAYPGRRHAPAETKRYLGRLLKPLGYHIAPAGQLPLKRLAVSAGLAEYGRNNVTYVEGMGSFLALTAYYSDVPCDESEWRDVCTMERCQGCSACLNNCPTGAIRKERFLIDNERCLSFFNEFPGDFPAWLDKSIHHCLYDCMMCQNVCPANRGRMEDAVGPIGFDAEETEMLLSGKALKELPPSLKKKVRFLGMDQWLAAIPRNLKMLLENAAES